MTAPRNVRIAEASDAKASVAEPRAPAMQIFSAVPKGAPGPARPLAWRAARPRLPCVLYALTLDPGKKYGSMEEQIVK